MIIDSVVLIKVAPVRQVADDDVVGYQAEVVDGPNHGTMPNVLLTKQFKLQLILNLYKVYKRNN